VQNRFDGKSAGLNTNDRNRMEATAAIASGRIRARCLRLERSRRISITVADAKQKRGMPTRTNAALIWAEIRMKNQWRRGSEILHFPIFYGECCPLVRFVVGQCQ
jgi:hypothetical protein